MWNVTDLFVLSDLHLAGERDSGLFQSDTELADCLTWILEESQASVTVLAGDTLDFLIPGDGETKTDFSRLGDRTKTIIEQHPEVFEALSNLVWSSRHKLIIMGGDHDSELVFPAVQEAIERRLGIEFSNPKVRWLVQGEILRLRVGTAVVLIEHGNVLDPWNRIEPASLHSALSLASRNLSNLSDYRPPTGSRLALEVIAALRSSHHWIDWLKPETETVLPLIWQFGSRKDRDLICNLTNEYLDMKEKALNKKIGNLSSPEMVYRGHKEAENSQQDKIFKKWFDYVYEQQETPRANGNVDAKLIEKLRSVSAQDTFFDLDKPDGSVKYLQPSFESGADLIIHGHTHSAKASAVQGGLYINTGTWGQLLQLPKSYETDDVWGNFLDLLRRNEVASLRRPTFARVRQLPEQDLTLASLLEWRKPEPMALTTLRFSERQTGWRRED